METFMNGATVAEGALLSFLLALWMAWMVLRGLFRLMPATSPSAGRTVQRTWFVASQQQESQQRERA